MPGRTLKPTRRFKKDYKALESTVTSQVDALLTELLEDRLAPGRDDKLRKPKKNGVRQCRVNLEYRLTYRRDGEELMLLRVATHREIERRDC